MITLGTQEAAALLRMSEDALMRKARAGIVPADKPGRQWVFIEEDLLAWIRERQKARACHSIAIQRARTGGSDSRSAASKLDARLKQLTDKRPTNSKPVLGLICGGKCDSESDPSTPGRRPSSAGIRKLTDATKSAKRSG